MFSFADNPAILPVNRVLRIMEGTPATLQVYVSGYPLVARSQIHWYRPNGTEILEDQARFEDDRRTMVLSEVQSTDGGLYRCEVNTSYGDRSTMIQLDVYGMKTITGSKQGGISFLNLLGSHGCQYCIQCACCIILFVYL